MLDNRGRVEPLAQNLLRLLLSVPMLIHDDVYSASIVVETEGRPKRPPNYPATNPKDLDE